MIIETAANIILRSYFRLTDKAIMKNIVLFFVLFLISFITSAQSANNCVLLIDGKEVKPQIAKDVLLKLCTLEIKDVRRTEVLKPVSLKWVYSSKGEIFQGDLHTCNKLEELAKKMKSGDVLFIDEIKYTGTAGLCQGQFALTIE